MKLGDFLRDQHRWSHGGAGLTALAYYVDRNPDDKRVTALEEHVGAHGLVGHDFQGLLVAYNPDPGDGDAAHDKFLTKLAKQAS